MTEQTDQLEASADCAADVSIDVGVLYDEYSVRVWRYVARLIGGDAHAVADAVQETFLAAARSLEQFDPQRGSSWSWLAGIAHRQAALHWRRVSVRKTDPAEARFEESPAGGDGPEQFMERGDTIEAVRAVMNQLPSDYVAVLQARYSDGLSTDEMVQLLGGTTEAIRSRLARARREFQRLFEARYDAVNES